jgi:hypothetical protein
MRNITLYTTYYIIWCTFFLVFVDMHAVCRDKIKNAKKKSEKRRNVKTSRWAMEIWPNGETWREQVGHRVIEIWRKGKESAPTLPHRGSHETNETGSVFSYIFQRVGGFMAMKLQSSLLLDTCKTVYFAHMSLHLICMKLVWHPIETGLTMLSAVRSARH